MVGHAVRPMALVAMSFVIGCGSSVSPAPSDGDAGADGAIDAAVADTSTDGAATTDADAAPSGTFGSPCKTGVECNSGICLSIGRCSKPCTGGGDCPASSNWSCVSLPARGPTCDCTVISSEDVPCNGIDDNCDGSIDETARTCGGKCTDTLTDSSNCGGCGLTCGGGTTCKGGLCVCPAEKPTICGTRCVDTTTDPTNCGKCGTACPSGPSGVAACSAGTCSLTCTVPYGDCNGMASDGCEKDLRADLANCGMCGRTCSYANAAAICSTGTCVLGACNSGFANCDSDPTNGCEANTGTSLAHCGGCGKTCAPANATGACTAGSCELLLCNSGYGNCNLAAADGCEINTQTDVRNCGTCGKVCPGTGAPNMTASCTAGVCGSACVTGFGNCDSDPSNGCETDLRSNVNKCGTCSTVCPTGNSCIDGVCRAFVPVDVTLLLGVTGSTQTSLNNALPNLKTRLVAPLLAMSGVQVGVSYTCEFPITPYGSSGDRPFQGGSEPITSATTLNSLIDGYPKLFGGDAPDAMVEALGNLAGLPVHPNSTALTCSTGRTAGGCWRSGARKVIVLFTDDIFHNGPNPVTPSTLYSPYTGITPAPLEWPAVKTAMLSSKITLLIMNSNSAGGASEGMGQYKLMLTDLGQTTADVYKSYDAITTGTAADEIVARVAAIRSGGP